MAETVSLVKDNPLLPAEDFAAMRREGIKSIEKLGSDIWTDYNTSDPGITILEAVIYAITDTAYRMGFEVKDLLAPENLTEDTWKQVFYTARQILHNSPITITDYRKMIVDVKGVRNAWIEPSKEYEVPMWIDYNYFTKRKEEECGCIEPARKTCFGRIDLEETTKQKVDKFLGDKLAETNAAIDKINTDKTPLLNEKKSIEDRINAGADGITLEQLKQRLSEIEKQLTKLEKKLKSLEEDKALITEMSGSANIIPSKIIELEGLYNVMVEYEEDVLEEDRREKVRQQVIQKLSGHRNLCEDFLTINAIEYVDFGIGASIALDEYADPDTVLAQVYFVIYKYFTPSIPFNTIQQMLEKGYDIDEIFEGPALQHGFIETSAIEKTDLFRDIRLSDIISEIADIKGIKAITYLHLPFAGFMDDSASKHFFDEWVQYLREESKVARIIPAMSQVIFCKERELITYNTGSASDKRPDRMLKFFRDLKTAERKYKLEGVLLDLPVPNGENMELEDYFPVTYSLPMCYGVSKRAGLPGDADEKRKVQALQLKGYLLFFEQLLSDQLVQLNHLRTLYTLDESVTRTYFTKALTGIEGVKKNFALEELLIDFNNHGSNHFDQILADFTYVLNNIVETPELFLERRNKFLNHFLARFSEEMSEYEAINRWLVPQQIEARLVQDKINILKDGEYYKIGSSRGRGFDYTKPFFWDTGNVSGTERRVGRLLGFANVKRRTLAPAFIITEPIMELNAKKQPEQKKNKKGQPVSIIKILSPENNEQVLLTSVEVIDGCCTELLMNDIIEHADTRKNFQFHDELNHRARKTAGPVGNFWFELYDGTDMKSAVLLATSARFDKREKRDMAFKALRAAIKAINENEGMHLVEHLLLRPKFDEVLDETNAGIPVSFLNICLDKCDLGIGLGEGTQVPSYRKKLSRIPAEKCYDKMPWILQYFRLNPTTKKYDQSILFQQTFPDKDEPIPLKFRKYAAVAKRVRDLQEFGSERINYILVSNEASDALQVKYSFKIMNGEIILAQSPFVFNKKTGTAEVPDDIEKEIEALMEWFGSEMDWYCEANSCDNNEDAYSFRATIVLPCWPKRLRNPTFRNLVEKTILTQSPAHTHIRVAWIGIPEMERFEKAYYSWLEEMAQNEMPAYEKVNPLVEVLNTLKPCGECEDDCGENTNQQT
ncbi:MAG: hypothetical protein JWP81_1794 [Ferruginibacter sp.]|nr:hypothetical protein [Ferruginibacter sp.]